MLSPAQKRDPVGQIFCAASIGVWPISEDFVESHSHATETRLDIIRLPRLFQFLHRPLAQLIFVLCAPKSKEGYAMRGGGLPLHKISDGKAYAIKMALEAKGISLSVYAGKRYWYPFTEEAIHQDNQACYAATLSTILHLHN
ncbi:ferrochelatase, putative [Ricinus communis]|uniref:Ferrochelatase, putative n=1 Tax=Ricinus communis TaxID=3988 RepID=B9S1D5_RICCO|nr:ferrochelatase, putative [Ricinus communis]